jgi:hypothetical protein
MSLFDQLTEPKAQGMLTLNDLTEETLEILYWNKGGYIFVEEKDIQKLKEDTLTSPLNDWASASILASFSNILFNSSSLIHTRPFIHAHYSINQ